ncbi:hypothetical protein [Aliivibrio fischeri]|uniref:hypothetical protein n=1 Tax=Aliivibrio fischeri TaxID=668 RepID=UPI00084BD623|nr:hypothetical protein [Aliivibrio fischeri]MUJ27997.1 hypothetical protein [Aliivibrio fischeri]OED52792.1 hypothetical protein BEI47_18885 [Aliivibrio fischeri]
MKLTIIILVIQIFLLGCTSSNKVNLDELKESSSCSNVLNDINENEQPYLYINTFDNCHVQDNNKLFDKYIYSLIISGQFNKLKKLDLDLDR